MWQNGPVYTTDHFNDFRINRLGKYASGSGHIINKLIETSPLNFFALQIRHWVHEVKDITTLQQLPHKQVLLLVWGCICNVSDMRVTSCRLLGFLTPYQCQNSMETIQ